MLYFFDCEFIEDGRTVDLISIGIVREDGRRLYLESAEAELERANDWVRENVLPKLGPPERRVSRAAIRKALVEFVGDDKPQFVADCGAYDWLCVCQLFGPMIMLPRRWPFFCLDIRQALWHHPRREELTRWLDEHLASQHTHNALDDAVALSQAWRVIVGAADGPLVSSPKTPPQDDDPTAAFFADLLARARSGEFLDAAVVATRRDNPDLWAYGTSINAHLGRTVLHLELFKASLTSKIFGISVPR